MAADDARRARQSIRTDLAFGVDAVLLGSDVRAGDEQARADSGLTAPDALDRSRPGPSLAAEAGRSAPGRGSTRSSTGAGGGGGAVGGAAALVPALPRTRAERESALASLAVRHAESCGHCTSVRDEARIVFGEGDPEAPIVFVGEAPGEQEDRTGRPFVGRAGAKLDEMITAMGLARDGVYIANVLKTRPPGNRTPLQHEIDACGPWLAAQLRIIRPRVIVTLGGPAAKLLLDTTAGITRLRGTWGSWHDGDVSIPVMPTFHPAYLLRNYTVETRRAVWNDLQAAKSRLV